MVTRVSKSDGKWDRGEWLAAPGEGMIAVGKCDNCGEPMTCITYRLGHGEKRWFCGRCDPEFND